MAIDLFKRTLGVLLRICTEARNAEQWRKPVGLTKFGGQFRCQATKNFV